MADILIVDDSNLSRRMMRRILEGAGHQVTEAADGIAALEAYFLHRPALVVMDLTMPGISGLELLTQLRGLDAGARVLVASADIQHSTQALAAQAGAAAFINKPFIADKVLAAVDAILAASAAATSTTSVNK